MIEFIKWQSDPEAQYQRKTTKKRFWSNWLFYGYCPHYWLVPQANTHGLTNISQDCTLVMTTAQQIPQGWLVVFMQLMINYRLFIFSKDCFFPFQIFIHFMVLKNPYLCSLFLLLGMKSIIYLSSSIYFMTNWYSNIQIYRYFGLL